MARQQFSHNRHARYRRLLVGDKVFMKNPGQGPHWLPGMVERQTGPVSFKVHLHNGTVARRHIDQLRKHFTKDSCHGEPHDESEDDLDVPSPTAQQELIENADPSAVVVQNPQPEQRRYPMRVRGPPNRYLHPLNY